MILFNNTNPAQAGGKGASLARLAEFGFNPPASFVIPADAFTASLLAAGRARHVVA